MVDSEKDKLWLHDRNFFRQEGSLLPCGKSLHFKELD